MPIGVPKIYYNIYGEKNYEWIEIYNRLAHERILLLTQEIDKDISNQIIGIIIYLRSENENRNISLYVNSNGGKNIFGIWLIGVIEYIKAEVYTINVGMAISTAAFIITGGS